MSTTNHSTTTEAALEPCPLSHYVHAGLSAHKTGLDPRIVCLDCGLTLRAPDWIKVYERWQSRPAVPVPSVANLTAWTSIDAWLRENPKATAAECLAELVKRIKVEARSVAPEVGENSVAFTAYNQAVEDSQAAIRAESQGGGYWAATFINAIARKCSPHVYVNRLAAPASTVAPVEQSVAARCPNCGARLTSDFDEDVGMWEECTECDYRNALSSRAAPASPAARRDEVYCVDCGHRNMNEGGVCVELVLGPEPQAGMIYCFCKCKFPATAQVITPEAKPRQRAIQLLRELRETTDPAEVERQKESWRQLEVDLSGAPPSTLAKAAKQIADEYYFNNEDTKANWKGREQEVYNDIAAIIERCFSGGAKGKEIAIRPNACFICGHEFCKRCETRCCECGAQHATSGTNNE